MMLESLTIKYNKLVHYFDNSQQGTENNKQESIIRDTVKKFF